MPHVLSGLLECLSPSSRTRLTLDWSTIRRPEAMPRRLKTRNETANHGLGTLAWEVITVRVTLWRRNARSAGNTAFACEIWVFQAGGSKC